MSDVDRYEPKLRVAASGYQGSGYRIPTRLGDDGKPLLVAGVTTALGAIDKPGLRQWQCDQVAMYAAMNAESLLAVPVERAFLRLRYYPTRMKSADFDDPLKDVSNAHSGVLHDLAELGTMTHTAAADILNDEIPDDLVRDEQAQMISKFLDWVDENDIEVIATEVTVVGDGYAGTLDYILRINGTVTIVDLKTSRKMRDEHIAQLAAIGAAESMLVETTEDDPDGVLYESKKWGKTWWKEEPLPPFTEYAILHLRPREDGREAFCHLEIIPNEVVDSAYDLFRGALAVRKAQLGLKRKKKEVGYEL